MKRRLFLTSPLALTIPLEEQDDATDTLERIAHWACDLNEWEWPEDWGDPPDWIVEKFSRDGRARYEYKKKRYAIMVHGLIDICGHREMLRVHNVYRLKLMTEEEFAEWWRKEHP